MPGTAPKLGWHRLGILLSVFWMIAVGIEWWVEVRQGPFSTGWVLAGAGLGLAQPCPSHKRLVGIVSLGDLATQGSLPKTARALHGISQPGGQHNQSQAA
jgi:hypothetical protein